jgi:aminopeptidase N
LISSENVTENPLWWIPITYTSKSRLNFNDTKPSHWLKATKNLTIQESFENSEWIVVNIQQTGYYRVNYDISNWKLINHHLNDPTRYTQIATPNRAQLIDDAMNLARAGYLDYSVALDVTRYVMHEKDYVPWKAMINAMNYIDSMLRKGPDYEQLKVFLDAEFFTAILKYFLLPEIPSATNGQNLQGNWIRGPENR